MVTVVAYSVKKNSKEEDFIVLEVQGAPEVVRSKETGRHYFTARKCNVPCTFNEFTAKKMVGTEMPGQIIKVECEPYDYVVESSGEIMEFSHRWEYSPEESPVTSEVSPSRANGVMA